MPGASTEFRPLQSVTARWCRLDGHGLEHLTLEKNANRITATGVVTADTPSLACGAWYQMFFDDRWRIKAVSVHLTNSTWFVASSPEPGQWCDGDGQPLDEFSGCRDVILPSSAFACTPLVRRLGVQTNHVVPAIELPLTDLQPARSRYRLASADTEAAVCLHDMQCDRSLHATLDDDGLAIEVKSLFKRLA